MSPEAFWISQDGQILTVQAKNTTTQFINLSFRPRHEAELEVLRFHLKHINFTERSSLARIGIEMVTKGKPCIDGPRILLEAEAFLYDKSFPNAEYWKKLLRPGIPVGRLFYAPDSAKLSTAEICEAVQENNLNLPNKISIDRLARFFLTPNRFRYTLNPRLQRPQFERVVSGEAGRGYLDKVQVRHEDNIISIPPRSGILTSCSMYLKDHFVLLNRGEGNFGLHTGAVLLDPIKTFGTNIMLEIYNTSDQPVVNPVVSVEIFRAPCYLDREFKTLQGKRKKMISLVARVSGRMEKSPTRPLTDIHPKTKITVKGQNALMENESLFLHAGSDLKKILNTNGKACGHRTMIQALDHAPENADTLIIDYFPNLLAHIELLTRIQQLKLKPIIFRKPSRTHGFFLSNNAHARLENYEAIDLDVYWYNESMKDIFLHTYKKDHGFFVREEMIKKLQTSSILPFYGPSVEVGSKSANRISNLIEKLTDFIGPSVGILTGGGGGVMRLATERARKRGSMTGACFLEL